MNRSTKENAFFIIQKLSQNYLFYITQKRPCSVFMLKKQKASRFFIGRLFEEIKGIFLSAHDKLSCSHYFIIGNKRAKINARLKICHAECHRPVFSIHIEIFYFVAQYVIHFYKRLCSITELVAYCGAGSSRIGKNSGYGSAGCS